MEKKIHQKKKRGRRTSKITRSRRSYSNGHLPYLAVFILLLKGGFHQRRSRSRSRKRTYDLVKIENRSRKRSLRSTESESEESERFPFFRFRLRLRAYDPVKVKCRSGRTRHRHWFILPLLLATPTMQFSLDRKRRSHKQNQCSACFSLDRIDLQFSNYDSDYYSVASENQPLEHALMHDAACAVTLSKDDGEPKDDTTKKRIFYRPISQMSRSVQCAYRSQNLLKLNM